MTCKYCSKQLHPRNKILCCRACFYKHGGHWIGKKRPEQARQQTGRKFSEETRQRLRESHLGNLGWWKGKTRPNMTGVKHPLWRGGQETERERKLVSENKRRVLKMNSLGAFTAQEWETLKKRFDYMCLCCKRFEPEIKLSIDHIKPLSLGGSNSIDNIQPLCRSCNCRKHAKHIDYISAYYTV